MYAGRELVPPERRGAEDPDPDYDHELLDGLADRWGVERTSDSTGVWFEIDRLRSSGKGAVRPGEA
jgi:hypothetical protein